MKQNTICRIHWLLHLLPKCFLKDYNCRFNYLNHNYCFYRLDTRKLLDIFIIIRTSKHCFRCSYYNIYTNQFIYFQSRSVEDITKKIYKIYKDNKKEYIKN